jgi:hypothetical protein
MNPSRYTQTCLASSLSIILVLFILCFGHATYAQDILQKKVSLRASNKDLFDLLKNLALENRICIGLEVAPRKPNQPRADSKISVSFDNKLLREVLDELMGDDSPYDWRAENNFVNIFPKQAYPNVLDIRVSEFNIDNQNKFEIRTALYALPEMKAALNEQHLLPGEVFIIKPLTANKERFSVQLHNTTIRAILNTIGQQTYFWATLIIDQRLFIIL